jgi:phosphohistidine phosphatase
MKSLLLLRHAKSSWKDASLPDFDRPLKKRGRKAAPLVGKLMRERKLRPDLVFCSPARRTRDTLELVLEKAKLDAEPVFDKRLYAASASELLQVLAEVGEDVDEVLLVGHNPGLEDLLEILTGEAPAVPTATLSRVALDIESWRDAREGSGRLEWIVHPGQLEEGG